MIKKNKKENITKESETKSVVKKYSNEEVKQKILQISKFEGELDQSLKSIGKDIIPKLLDGDEKEKDEAEKKLEEKLGELMISMSADTHWDIIETFRQQYRGLAKELTSQLIQEYGCKTYSEKALATLTANAYIRMIDNSRRFNGCAEAAEYLSDDRTRYLAMLSKQMDRAHRQFISSLITLKQIKSPAIEMNIKTNTAFVAQNQQINTDYPPKSTKNENNESK